MKNYVYGINIDNEIFGFVKDEEEAKICIKNLADGIEKILKDKKPYKEFYKEMHENSIEIFSLGKKYVWRNLKHVHSIIYYKISQRENENEVTENENEVTENENEVTDNEVVGVKDKNGVENNKDGIINIDDTESDEDNWEDDDEDDIEFETERKKRFFPFLFPPHPIFFKMM